MKVLIGLCCVFALAWAQERAGIDAERFSVVDQLWDSLTKDADDTVDASNLDDFYRRYDNKDDSPLKLNIYEGDFNSGDSSAVRDFAVSETNAVVYFKIQDLVDYHDEVPDFFERLTREDVDVLAAIGDADFDGRLNETEFKEGMLRVFRGSNMGKIYVNFRPSEGTGMYDDYLRLNDWLGAFDTWDTDNDGVLDNNQFASAWVSGGYGDGSQARELFILLDIENSGYIYREEWIIVFYACDYDADNYLSFEEVLVLDYLLNEGAFPRVEDASKRARNNQMKIHQT